MKIASSVRESYRTQRDLNGILSDRVARKISALKSPRWHFESRLKSEESFAVKVESGSVKDPDRLEDFLAATLVVPNLSDVNAAEALVCSTFHLVERRPTDPRVPSGPPSSFMFDDVRLYLMIEPDDALPPEASDGIVFEVQVKTFLEHAWSVATHDTIYKATSLSWPRERIATQVKAMLEHAEVTIDNVKVLEAASALPVKYAKYQELNELIAVIQDEWSDGALPEDLKRLASAVLRVARGVANLGVAEVRHLLKNGRARYGDSHNTDWSPYRAVTEYLLDEHPSQFLKFVCASKGRDSFFYAETVARANLPTGRRVVSTVM